MSRYISLTLSILLVVLNVSLVLSSSLSLSSDDDSQSQYTSPSTLRSLYTHSELSSPSAFSSYLSATTLSPSRLAHLSSLPSPLSLSRFPPGKGLTQDGVWASCADLTDCEGCYNVTGCHFCDNDRKCHTIGSLYGCVWGLTCNTTNPCLRTEPFFYGYGSVPLSYYVMTVIAITCVGCVLYCAVYVLFFGLPCFKRDNIYTQIQQPIPTQIQMGPNQVQGRPNNSVVDPQPQSIQGERIERSRSSSNSSSVGDRRVEDERMGERWIN